MSDLVGNPEDRFSQNEAPFILDNERQKHMLLFMFALIETVLNSTHNLCLKQN